MKQDVEITKHTLNLRKGDMEYLRGMFPSQASEVIRALVSRYIDDLRSKKGNPK